ncbi:MAG: hypothetical protein QOJ07_2135 [Thermoleophilaceae bacterium]|nr:hypothetical protein [Thermoleophilaceae bacterium]
MRSIRLLSLVLVLAAVPALAACGDKTVAKAEVAKQAQLKLDEVAKAAGKGAYPKITCPNDLKAKKGAKETCTATGPGGKKLNVVVTVDSVNGDKANLNFQGDAF